MPLLARRATGLSQGQSPSQIRGWALVLGLLTLPGCFEDPEGPTATGTGGSTSLGEETGTPGTTQDSSDPTTDPTTNPSGGGCMGCLDAEGGCLAGGQDNACGALAALCVVCNENEYCNEGTCETRPLCTPDNCQGCCVGDECVGGNEDAACGHSGQMCTECSGQTACNEGFCELPCADTCDGCCDATGDCVPLGELSDKNCGIQGASCSPCDPEFECNEGVCISTACTMTCADGCCDGSECLDGNSDDACGGGGNACAVCPNGTSCEGGCTPSPGTLWDLRVDSGSLPPNLPSGEDWDPGGGAPDPFLRVTLADGSVFETSVEDHTFVPQWDERLELGVSAEELMQVSVLEVRDEDVFGSELAGACEVSMQPEWFGTPVGVLCEDGGMNELYTLYFTLLPSEG